ncbi:hypothetical protein [Flammeovirga sp. EKP202]|uniref:hypothetical protein n=1 Tax=Flammeovirga sp. EKP202 TaxID=2770592 RepID=UPI00165F9A56|nr:hypothetical protein [Flammeovirga sp. EKP202]MBD0403694.1 hypothetical protein [Flammeovirga sp. EKP202]
MLKEGTVYKGEGTYEYLSKEYTTTFELEQVGIKWYASGINIPHEYFKESKPLSIKGILEIGNLPIKLIVGGQSNRRGQVLEASVLQSNIGLVSEISTVSSQLFGVYFKSQFSFNFEDLKIQILPTQTNLSEARKAFKGNGFISKGNVIHIKGEELDLKRVNNIIGKVCVLLTSITFSNVVFGHLNINEDQGIIIPERKMKYTSDISFSYAVMDSAPNLENFFKEAFPKYLSLSEEYEAIIFNISYALMVSSSTLLQESRMFELISYFENFAKYKNNNSPLKCLREEWIQYLDTNDFEYDLEVVKELVKLRNSLAHSAIFPKIEFSQAKHEYIVLLQKILFISLLDILEADVLIQYYDKDGWRDFGKKDELKNIQM